MMTSFLRQETVSEGVVVFDGHYDSPTDYSKGNVTATVVHDGKDAFVFDSLWFPNDTKEMLRGLKSMGLNIVGLVNTHWHWDHTAGNQMFFDTKRIISHSLSIELMQKFLTWDDFNKKLKEKEKIRTVYPTETFEESRTKLSLGNKEIEIIHTPGHTPDSIVAYLKDEHVIIAGDAVMELPFFWFGDSKPLLASLKKIQSIDGRARIIQGHGGICSPKKIDDDVSYIENLRDLVQKYFDSGKSEKEAENEIRLEDCISKERLETMPVAWIQMSRTAIHPGNVVRTYHELNQKADGDNS
jgi:glyoxylase-like metal-dependent hydrolase (beta-lactamase superfamily II)